MKIISHSEERREKLAEHLNQLIAICKDGEAGYRSATQETKDKDLQQLFHRLALQRATFATELQAVVARLDCEPRDTSTLAGALHRGWAMVKTALSRHDSHAALAECERGEDVAVAAYRKVLSEAPLDGELRALISTEAVAIKDAHDEIRLLRDLPAYQHSN
jgi:uncharacterized protein (TIGR02284 family)